MATEASSAISTNDPATDRDEQPTTPPAEADAPVVVTPDMLREGDPPTGWFGEKYRAFENWLTEKSTESNRWHRFLAWVFLPLAYRSGIKLGQRSESGDYEVAVPFTTFNKNWYNAMAGAALLGNSEVAGGMYIFNQVGPDYTVVCKELNYKFRLPCVGPAIYRVKPVDDIAELKKHKLEFNVTVQMQIVQAVRHKDEKERKVGKATATFHVAPKSKLRARQAMSQAPPPARLGLGLVWPAMLCLAATIGALVLTHWWPAVIAGVGMIGFTSTAWGYLIQHRKPQRWVALVATVFTMIGLTGLGIWAAIEQSMLWTSLSFGAAASLFIAAIAIAWPIKPPKLD
jgi:acyl-coenzyme A thioesterase PaaI-like protein